jgi:hypothetical protein
MKMSDRRDHILLFGNIEIGDRAALLEEVDFLITIRYWKEPDGFYLQDYKAVREIEAVHLVQQMPCRPFWERANFQEHEPFSKREFVFLYDDRPRPNQRGWKVYKNIAEITAIVPDLDAMLRKLQEDEGDRL